MNYSATTTTNTTGPVVYEAPVAPVRYFKTTNALGQQVAISEYDKDRFFELQNAYYKMMRQREKWGG